MRRWSRGCGMNQRPAPLLSGPCQKGSHQLHSDRFSALLMAGKVGMAEPRVDCIDDNKWVCVGGSLGDFSSGEELEKFGDWVYIRMYN